MSDDVFVNGIAMLKLAIVLACIKWFMSDVFSDHTWERSTICSRI